MKVLLKFNDNGYCAVAAGLEASHIVEKIGKELGTSVVVDDISELSLFCSKENTGCVVIPLNDKDAEEAEQVIALSPLDARFLIFVKNDEEESESNGQFYILATSFFHLKSIVRIINLFNWKSWEFDKEGTLVHEKYRKLINRISDSVVRFNAKGAITWANTTFYDWIGKKETDNLSIDSVFEQNSVITMKLCLSHLRHGIIIPFIVGLKCGKLVSLDPTPRFLNNGEFDGLVALMRLLDGNSETVLKEYEESRVTTYLTSLSLALNEIFEIKAIVKEMNTAIRRLCGEVTIGVLIDGEDPIIDCGKVPVSDVLVEHMGEFAYNFTPEKNILVVKNMRSDSLPIVSVLKEYGCMGAVCFALKVTNKCLGRVWIVFHESVTSMRERSSMLIATGNMVGMALQNAINVRAMLEEQTNRRRFYSDALAAVTGNKLVLCEYDELDKYWNDFSSREISLELRDSSDVHKARSLASEEFLKVNIQDDVSFGMITCISEAATNVIKYGAPGKMRLKISKNTIKVRFDDSGSGIAVDKLPKAILTSGYSESSTPSLGLGFSVMLKLCSTLRIATGKAGTYLLLEAELDKKEVDPLDKFVAF